MFHNKHQCEQLSKLEANNCSFQGNSQRYTTTVLKRKKEKKWFNILSQSQKSKIRF